MHLLPENLAGAARTTDTQHWKKTQHWVAWWKRERTHRLHCKAFTEKETEDWDSTANTNNPLYDLLPPQKSSFLRSRGHDFTLPRVRTERFKQCFINRCLFYFA